MSFQIETEHVSVTFTKCHSTHIANINNSFRVWGSVRQGCCDNNRVWDELSEYQLGDKRRQALSQVCVPSGQLFQLFFLICKIETLDQPCRLQEIEWLNAQHTAGAQKTAFVSAWIGVLGLQDTKIINIHPTPTCQVPPMCNLVSAHRAMTESQNNKLLLLDKPPF